MDECCNAKSVSKPQWPKLININIYRTVRCFPSKKQCIMQSSFYRPYRVPGILRTVSYDRVIKNCLLYVHMYNN